MLPFDLLWQQYKRIIKPREAIVLTAQVPFTMTLATSNLPSLKYEWIWSKSKATGHLNAKRQPLRNHEHILVFCDGTPTYNPQNLIRVETPILRTFTNPGELVLDSCIGSGTTAVACINSGRHWIGFESDPKYHAIAIERVARAQA